VDAFWIERMVAVLTWRMLSMTICSIYIVEILGPFHVNAEVFFAARKNDFVVILH